MDTKFNSLFSYDDIKNNNVYNINNVDDIGLDDRIKQNPLILNYYVKDLEYMKYLNERRYGNLPVTIIPPRSCSTSLCTSNKFCDSSGKPEILHDVPLSCENDFSPQGQKSNPKRYIANIDAESRLFNIDYITKNKSCGKKELKEPNLKSLDCYKDTIFLSDRMNFKNQSYKHDPNKNKQCNVYIEEPLFNESSKRIDTVTW
jgi:hypothetical protein